MMHDDLPTADAVCLLSSPAVITLRGDAAQTMTRLLLCNQPRMAAAEDVLMPVCGKRIHFVILFSSRVLCFEVHGPLMSHIETYNLPSILIKRRSDT